MEDRIERLEAKLLQVERMVVGLNDAELPQKQGTMPGIARAVYRLDVPLSPAAPLPEKVGALWHYSRVLSATPHFARILGARPDELHGLRTCQVIDEAEPENRLAIEQFAARGFRLVRGRVWGWNRETRERISFNRVACGIFEGGKLAEVCILSIPGIEAAGVGWR